MNKEKQSAVEAIGKTEIDGDVETVVCSRDDCVLGNLAMPPFVWNRPSPLAQSERLSAVHEAFAEVRERAMTNDGHEYRIGGISQAMTAVLKEMETK